MLSPIPLPQPMLDALVQLRLADARPYIVGGAVRDHLLGIAPKDFDTEVFGLTLSEIAGALGALGTVSLVGESFGVAKLRVGADEFDFSMPRTESKQGIGHKGFEVAHAPNLGLGQAAQRRDFTINAIYYDPFLEQFEDPFNGIQDLEMGILRHVGPAFSEDPLRVLRAFQFASRFDFAVAPETVELCRQLKPEFSTLDPERIWMEWQKWGEKAEAPERGLQFLDECGWLEFFPELNALHGVKQSPMHHPEGDAWGHTLHCLAAIRRCETATFPGDKLVIQFAVLLHDLGKATHTQVDAEGKISSYGHDEAGGPLARAFLTRLHAPNEVVDKVVPLVANHMIRAREYTAKSIRRAAVRVHPANLRMLCAVMEADSRGRPPRPDECPQNVLDILARAEECAVVHEKPKPVIMGRHLLPFGIKPGPEMGAILKIAQDAFLEGKFTTVEEGLALLHERGAL